MYQAYLGTGRVRRTALRGRQPDLGIPNKQGNIPPTGEGRRELWGLWLFDKIRKLRTFPSGSWELSCVRKEGERKSNQDMKSYGKKGQIFKGLVFKEKKRIKVGARGQESKCHPIN